jgi:hypothetical protein
MAHLEKSTERVCTLAIPIRGEPDVKDIAYDASKGKTSPMK